MSEAPKITREDLARLLRDKIAKQAAYSTAFLASTYSSTISLDGDALEAAVDADILCKQAYTMSCAADNAYSAALTSFVAQATE